MDKSNISDENFIRKYEAYETRAVRDEPDKYGTADSELTELIGYLIERRVAIKRAELERLEAESGSLIEKLRHNEKQQLLEELECFKDTLALQKQLLGENDKP